MARYFVLVSHIQVKFVQDPSRNSQFTGLKDYSLYARLYVAQCKACIEREPYPNRLKNFYIKNEYDAVSLEYMIPEVKRF